MREIHLCPVSYLFPVAALTVVFFFNLLIFPGFLFQKRVMTLPYTESDSLATEVAPFAEVFRKPFVILRNYSVKTYLLS